MRIKNTKQILNCISLAATVVGFGVQIVSNMVDDKKQKIEIRDAVRKELARQQALPMKRRGS